MEDPNWLRILGPGLSSCGSCKTGCFLNAPLLPGPWFWLPWTQPGRKLSFLPETFAGVSQLDDPEGHLELWCWEEYGGLFNDHMLTEQWETAGHAEYLVDYPVSEGAFIFRG